MPSYIELDKQSSFPPSSNVGKMIFGVKTNEKAALTDHLGNTTEIGGGGIGLNIPQPIPYRTSVGSEHFFRQNISSLGDGSGLPGAIQSSWNNQILKLTYQTSDLNFLNYNPKYFLFLYGKHRKYGRAGSTGNNTDTRINNQKYGRYFFHPASFSGFGVNSNAQYTNFSTYENFSVFNGSFSAFTTEWSVASGSGQSTILEGFNPSRFYYFVDNDNTINNRGVEFFPLRTDKIFSGTPYFLSVTTLKNYISYISTKTGGGVESNPHPRVNLYCKFAIVINNPNDPNRFIIGPMSDTIKIFPKSGYFIDDVDTGDTFRYYYSWDWKVV